MPTLTQLEYILALHRTGHFGRAAEACHVSQPTLSVQVAKAEGELGVTIFDRRSKPIAATEKGQELIALAREVVVAHERMLAAASGAPVLSGSFTLGVIPTLSPYLLPSFLGAFAEAYPQVELTVQECPTEEIMREIQGMRMDAGLLATPLGEPGIDKHVLFYDPFYVYAHADSPLLEQGEVSVGDIDRAELWLLEDGHCFREQMVYLCGLHAREIMQSVRFDAGSFETLRGLIDRSGGYTLIPESYARTLPRDVRLARVRAFRDPVPTREVSLVAHRAHWKTDILQALAATMREHAPRSLPRELGAAEVMPIYT